MVEQKPSSCVERISGEAADILGEIPIRPATAVLDAFSFQRPQKDIFCEDKKHRAWDKSVEARCDFTERIRSERRAGIRFLAIWEKSLYGRTLTDIKSDDAMVPFFANALAPLIAETLGNNLTMGDWGIVTSPKRRHRQRNFASMIAAALAKQLHIPFYEDVAMCHSRHRIGAIFTLLYLPPEQNLIVFDDFVTTGSTLQSMRNLFIQYHKNLVFFAGINNKL